MGLFDHKEEPVKKGKAKKKKGGRVEQKGVSPEISLSPKGEALSTINRLEEEGEEKPPLANPSAELLSLFDTPTPPVRAIPNPVPLNSNRPVQTVPLENASGEGTTQTHISSSSMTGEITTLSREVTPAFVSGSRATRRRPRVGFGRDIGRVRETNQDSLFTLFATVPAAEKDIDFGLLVIADGMGGHKDGEVASNLAVRTVASVVISRMYLPLIAPIKGEGEDDPILNILITAVQEANRVVIKAGREAESDMGTTLSVALLLGKTAYVAHVGDSRVYAFADNELQQITVDHSLVGRLIELGQMSPADVHNNPQRSVLYRTIGQSEKLEVSTYLQNLNGMRGLVLCSDGLWDMVSDAQMRVILQATPDPEDAAYRLIEAANDHGGEDNISVIIATFGQ